MFKKSVLAALAILAVGFSAQANSICNVGSVGLSTDGKTGEANYVYDEADNVVINFGEYYENEITYSHDKGFVFGKFKDSNVNVSLSGGGKILQLSRRNSDGSAGATSFVCGYK